MIESHISTYEKNETRCEEKECISNTPLLLQRIHICDNTSLICEFITNNTAQALSTSIATLLLCVSKII